MALSVLSAAQAAAETQRGEAAVPTAFGMQLKGDDLDAATLDRIRDLGVMWVRKGIYWNDMEKTKGEYDFSYTDMLVKELCDERGFRLLIVLFRSNKLYENTKPGGVLTEPGRKGFAAWAAAVAGRYKDKDVIYEVWNEPNVRTFWGWHGKRKANSDEYAEEYTALVKETVPAMLEADPDCFVLGGSTSNLWSQSYNWIGYCFKRGIHESGIKGWSVHPYSKGVEQYPEAYATVRKIMAEHGGGHLPLYNSERGFPTKKAEGWAGGDPNDAGTQLQYQAWHFVRQYLIDAMCDIRLTIWYEWHGNKFGIWHGGSLRPAYTAGRVLIDELTGYAYARRLPTDKKQDYVLLFQNANGGRKLAAWTSPPDGKSPQKTVAHEATVMVDTNASAVRVCDIYGNKSSVPVVSGQITLALSGAPQYVTLDASTTVARRVPEKKDGRPVVRTLAARPVPTRIGMAMFDELLRNRIRQELAAGKHPHFFYSSGRVDLTIDAIDDDGRIQATAKREGTSIAVSWSDLSLADRTGLATATYRKGKDADNAIAAFFLIALGDDDRGREYLSRAGALREEVLKAFE